MRRASHNSGSTLLISFWALLLLSAAIFSWVKYVNQGIDLTRNANAGLEARAFAYSGVQVAFHPDVTRQTPLLNHDFSPGHGYKAELTGEAGKLNLNWILQETEPNGPRTLLLKNYLSRKGLAYQERETLIDCLRDWIDPDNIRHLNGAEEDANYRPPNRGRLLSLDELAEIKGTAPLLDLPAWQEDFTLLSQGPIDLMHASQDVLSSIPAVGDARAQRFIQVRQGQDRVDGTPDDFVFPSVPAEQIAKSYLGISQQDMESLQGMFAFNEPLFRVISTGQAGNVYRQLEVVFRRMPRAATAGGAPGEKPHILLWKEL
jgi:hypothetical protein